VSDIFGHVLRPTLSGVEGDDPDRVAVLAAKKVLDDGFKVRGFVVGFAPGAA
jgi:hypothetical protein